MKEPDWIDHNFILVLQEELIATYGGCSRIRDRERLDSSLNRPQQIFSYGNPDLFDLSATHVSGIIRDHPFIDGNKQTALVTGIVFLERNGNFFSAPEAETTQAILDLVEKK